MIISFILMTALTEKALILPLERKRLIKALMKTIFSKKAARDLKKIG